MAQNYISLHLVNCNFFDSLFDRKGLLFDIDSADVWYIGRLLLAFNEITCDMVSLLKFHGNGMDTKYFQITFLTYDICDVMMFMQNKVKVCI